MATATSTGPDGEVAVLLAPTEARLSVATRDPSTGTWDVDAVDDAGNLGDRRTPLLVAHAPDGEPWAFSRHFYGYGLTRTNKGFAALHPNGAAWEQVTLVPDEVEVGTVHGVHLPAEGKVVFLWTEKILDDGDYKYALKTAVFDLASGTMTEPMVISEDGPALDDNDGDRIWSSVAPTGDEGVYVLPTEAAYMTGTFDAEGFGPMTAIDAEVISNADTSMMGLLRDRCGTPVAWTAAYGTTTFDQETVFVPLP